MSYKILIRTHLSWIQKLWKTDFEWESRCKFKMLYLDFRTRYLAFSLKNISVHILHSRYNHAHLGYKKLHILDIQVAWVRIKMIILDSQYTVLGLSRNRATNPRESCHAKFRNEPIYFGFKKYENQDWTGNRDVNLRCCTWIFEQGILDFQ